MKTGTNFQIPEKQTFGDFAFKICKRYFTKI